MGETQHAIIEKTRQNRDYSAPVESPWVGAETLLIKTAMASLSCSSLHSKHPPRAGIAL
jgi:hypothetical protein